MKRGRLSDEVINACSILGLSWDEGHGATWGRTESGEDVWELVLMSDARSIGDIHFKPLINDEVWAKGADYVARIG